MNDLYEYLNEGEIDQNLHCSICLYPFNDPCIVPCGDTFCRECITQWIQSGQLSCPLCRRQLQSTNLIPAPHSFRNILDQLPVKCRPCGRTGLQRSDFKTHVKNVCPKTNISCPSASAGCGWTGRREKLDRHLREWPNHSNPTPPRQEQVMNLSTEDTSRCDIVLLLCLLER
jgi:hypothetical protein